MPRDVSYPGVYIEESASDARPIPGVSTSTAAFVGQAVKGPINEATPVTGFAEFEQQFGGLSPGQELGYAVQQFFLNGGTSALVVRAGDAGSDDDLIGGITSLDSADIFNLLIVPGVGSPAIIRAAVDYCHQRRAFLIIDAPASAETVPQMKQVVQSGLLPQIPDGAVYYPWVRIPDPLNGGTLRSTPPSGAVAGVIARTDANHGIWRAAAGQEAILVSAQATDNNLTDLENEDLSSRGINCIRIFPGAGPIVWGARTLAGDDQLGSDWKYAPVRRMALFLEESIDRGTRWVVFEANNEALWAQIRLSVSAFLHGLFLKRAFQGQSPKDAYFVKCDLTTVTETDIAEGVVNIVVGFAPLKPAEFVIISIRQLLDQRD
jgi:phage tail sheath protein FI